MEILTLGTHSAIAYGFTSSTVGGVEAYSHIHKLDNDVRAARRSHYLHNSNAMITELTHGCLRAIASFRNAKLT